MALTTSSGELFGSYKHYLKPVSSTGEWDMTSCPPMRKYPSETLIHALKDCPTTHEILILGGLNNNLLIDVLRVLDQKATSNFITTLWNSWNNRNNFIFLGSKEEEARVVWERAVALCHGFHIHNLLNKPLLSVITADKKWMKPPYGIVKINFDAIVLKKKMGYGMLAYDSDDFVIGGGASAIDTDIQVEWEKLKVFEESLNFATSLNFPNLVFKTNCISLINRINKRGQDITLLGHRINDVCKLLEYFNSPKIMWAIKVIIGLRITFVKWLWIKIVI
ncbi:Transcription factor TFIIIB component B'' [Gossypium australe]|uniref:Transcription factor TFIIIB component B n=1 Tax=Gossypium australe TaxID=47621 RepID=A0A5B6X005_9ROSI|nr:Transcription factor TFIIIB component B'' [Gossypium australe]